MNRVQGREENEKSRRGARIHGSIIGIAISATEFRLVMSWGNCFLGAFCGGS